MDFSARIQDLSISIVETEDPTRLRGIALRCYAGERLAQRDGNAAAAEAYRRLGEVAGFKAVSDVWVAPLFRATAYARPLVSQ